MASVEVLVRINLLAARNQVGVDQDLLLALQDCYSLDLLLGKRPLFSKRIYVKAHGNHNNQCAQERHYRLGKHRTIWYSIKEWKRDQYCDYGARNNNRSKWLECDVIE